MPFHWKILLIDTYFAVQYFRLFPYDLIPQVTVYVMKQILHGSIGKIWHTTSPRYWWDSLSVPQESIVPYFSSNHVVFVYCLPLFMTRSLKIGKSMEELECYLSFHFYFDFLNFNCVIYENTVKSFLCILHN